MPGCVIPRGALSLARGPAHSGACRGGFKPTLGQLLSMGEGSPPPPPLLLLLAPCAVSKHRLVGHQPRAAGEAGGVSVMSRCRANGTKRVS